jgi:hypothetical protein
LFCHYAGSAGSDQFCLRSFQFSRSGLSVFYFLQSFLRCLLIVTDIDTIWIMINIYWMIVIV